MAQTHRFFSADDELFAADADALAGPRRDALLEDGFTGVAIDAPFSVDVSRRATLPVFGVFARPAAQRADFTQDAMVVIVDRDGPGFASAAALLSEKGDPGDDDPVGGSGVIAESFAFDARARVASLPWGRARLRVYVAHRDMLSDGINVALEGEQGGALGPSALLDAATPSGGEAEQAPLVLHGPPRATTEPGGVVMLTGSVRGEGPQQWVHVLALGPAPTPFSASMQVTVRKGLGHLRAQPARRQPAAQGARTVACLRVLRRARGGSGHDRAHRRRQALVAAQRSPLRSGSRSTRRLLRAPRRGASLRSPDAAGSSRQGPRRVGTSRAVAGIARRASDGPRGACP